MGFNELIGNEKIKENLIKILKNKTIAHSYMFIGNKGIGKKLFAKEFASGILCINENEILCKKCKSCIEFENNNNPDYYEIGLEEEENSIKIETVRQMQKKIQELPIVSNKKVYIIDDSEYLTKDAQNCLLKTLEEPPEFITIILIVSDENKILNTIKSRCMKIYFNNLSDLELSKYINENLEQNNFSTSMIKACAGSPGKVQQINRNKELYEAIESIFSNLENYTLLEIVPKIDLIYKNKNDIQEILEYINTIFIDKAKEDIKYIEYIKYIEETKRNINANCNYDMCIDKLIFSIFEK